MRTHTDLCKALDVTSRAIQHMVDLGIVYHASDTPKRGRGKRRYFSNEEWMFAHIAHELVQRDEPLGNVKVIVDAIRTQVANSEHDLIAEALGGETAVVFAMLHDVSKDGEGVGAILRLPVVVEHDDHFEIGDEGFIERLIEKPKDVARIYALLQRPLYTVPLNDVVQRAFQTFTHAEDA